MDGLSVSPPIGDANYQSLRTEIAIAGFGQPNGALQLDSTFGLHPRLETVHALALKGEARIAPAIATPDRARSHFEAQDVLESGQPATQATSGWLNRAMESLSASRTVHGHVRSAAGATHSARAEMEGGLLVAGRTGGSATPGWRRS